MVPGHGHHIDIRRSDAPRVAIDVGWLTWGFSLWDSFGTMCRVENGLSLKAARRYSVLRSRLR